MRFIFLVLVYCIHFICFSQKQNDLFKQLKTANTDTQKVTILNNLTKHYLDFNVDSASIINKQALGIITKSKLEQKSYKTFYYKALIFRKKKNNDSALVTIKAAQNIAIKYNNLSEQANALHFIGTIYDQLNNTNTAFEYYTKALLLANKINDKKEKMSTYLSMGISNKKINKNTDALKNLLEALKIAEELKDSSIIFTININLGTIYERIKENDKAFECYRGALIINESDKNENDKAICFYKLGKLFHKVKQIDSAKKYLLATLKIHEKRNDEEGLIMDYANLGGFSFEERDFVNAEKNYHKALELGLKFKDSSRINTMYSSLGMLAEQQNKLDQAIHYFNIGLKYINKTVSRETIMHYYKRMSDVYVRQKKYKEALNAYTLYKAWGDSAFNVNEARKQTELKMNYEFEQVQKKIEEENKAKEILSKAELEKERLQRNYLLAGFLVISILLVITIKNYRAKEKANTILHKQKKEIEHQKKLVEEKNNEISDSINYAKRIQTATIPKQSELNQFLTNYDILFKPKDVVSGDFYWAEKFENLVLVAVADCTGHGVPGAITSTIGSILLNEIFHVKRIYQPNLVLQELNRLVKLTLRQEENSLANDGMDIAFCMVDKSTNTLYYSGANRPIYIITSDGLQEYKPSKVSIGGQVPLIQEYNLTEIKLNVNDIIVLTSDGYADQFGGEKEKKFTTKAFKSLLNDCVNSSPEHLIKTLENSHLNWKKNHEQTDDILVFAFRLS